MTVYARRQQATVRPQQATSVCDGCRHTFPADELRWRVRHWYTSRLECGEVTAKLCSRCERLAWKHCWRCGALTQFDVCDDCR